MKAPRRRKPSVFRSGLTLALVTILIQPGLSRVPDDRGVSTQSQSSSRIAKDVKVGQDAAQHVAQRRQAESRFQERWDNTRISKRSDGLSNLRVTTLKRKPRSVGILARLADTLFGPTVVEASPKFDDCEEWLPTSLDAFTSAAVQRVLARLDDCEEVEEVNVYQDGFESSYTVTGSIGLSVTIEIVANSNYNYQEAEVEANFPVVDLGNGYAAVDPEFVEDLQTVHFVPPTLLWWIFSDEGYGANDNFGDSGIPCDQSADIKGWVLQQAWDNAKNPITAVAGAITGVVACLMGTGGLTAWALTQCAASGTFWSMWGTFVGALAYLEAKFLLDCVLDILAPAPVNLKPGGPLELVRQPAFVAGV